MACPPAGGWDRQSAKRERRRRAAVEEPDVETALARVASLAHELVQARR
jgi:hypothetical protein